VSAIFGVVARRDSGLDVRTTFSSLRTAVKGWARDGFGEWCDGVAALGQARTYSTPESRFESLPAEHREAPFAFTAAARLDNREELAGELDLIGRLEGIGDGELLMAAYARWGERTPSRVLGDWCLAAWHPRERRLFVARDRFGVTALYYLVDATAFAFACSPQALLAIGLARPKLDELYLGQFLLSWPAYHGEQTMSGAVRRLPPAHQLTVTPDRLDVRCYWRMEDVAPLRLRSRADYVDGLRSHLDAAVDARLRSTGPVGASLSGGLDSGSVVATAAELLREQERGLSAFTAAPMFDTRPFVPRGIGDELPLARATAGACGNVEVSPIRGRHLSPIGGIRSALDVLGAPVHGAANMFWILELLETAHAHGCDVVLSAQFGNAVTSWWGDPLSQPFAYRLRKLGALGLAKATLKRTLPQSVLVARWRRVLDPEWIRLTALRPDFVARLRLLERRLDDPGESPRSPLGERLRILKPGRSLDGAFRAALGATHQLDFRDPTADVRLISYMLSVPDEVFIDPGTGTDRWLIREAMRGRLPDEVRLNRRVGVQAADLVPRLRATAAEVDGALVELSDGPAAAYLDVPYMRETWGVIKREDTREAFQRAVTVLMRGIMAGLYVNSLDRTPMRPAATAPR
jgi:asparagine synthase (glutamine-hydrolysing)